MILLQAVAAILLLANGPAGGTSEVPGPAVLSKFSVECSILDKKHPFRVPAITVLDGGTASVRDLSEAPIVVARRTVDGQSRPLTRVFSSGTTLDATVTRLTADEVLLEIDLELKRFDADPPTSAGTEVRVHSVTRQLARRVPLGASTVVEIKDLKLEIRVAEAN